MVNIVARIAALIALSAPAMPRFFFSDSFSTRFFRPAPGANFRVAFGLGISLVCSAFGATPSARADEFSVLPSGDPIAVQLALIASGPAPASLTRYEAALQTARVILDVQSRPAGTVSRVQWRAIAALSEALKNELRQLGIDADAARALANQNLKSASSGADAPKPATPSTTKAAPMAPRANASQDLARGNPSFLGPPLLQGASPNKNTGVASGLSSQSALSYDLGRFLTLRAANSRLEWDGSGQSPLLGAPLFAGAQSANGTGGGLDLNLGAGLKFSTEIERLRADTGALASRIGGGASLSAWQDRFLLNLSLSRLSPQDKSALPATAAEVGASLGVSSRLSLNLSYQGLFAPIPSASASRVAGGVSLRF